MPDTESAPLTKIDSAVQGLSISPPKAKGHRRMSSTAEGVYNINDLGMSCPQFILIELHFILKVHSTPLRNITDYE
jgi:hypothetical protein